MVARDDSVIRGSLIACMIFLVLSIALNIFLWQWGDRQASEQVTAAQKLQTVNNKIRNTEGQLARLKAMLGQGGFTQAQIDEMKQNASDDPSMQAIEEQFSRDMSYFGQEVEAQNRNYPRLPEYLVNAIRSRNEQYSMARDEATKIRTDAEAEIANARTAQQVAEQKATDANKKVATLSEQFDQDRATMIQEKEATKDKLNKNVQDSRVARAKAAEEINNLENKSRTLLGTIETQKLQINELRSDQFETTQGEIRYVVSGGNITTINLGSADQLRPGVTFGVIDGDETRLQDAKVKATIQVTQVQGPHLAQARVVARPEIRNPIIPGDRIYSPFWAPGRKVKIAMAGEIDIDDDGRPDNDEIKGQVRAAGAEVVAEISSSGAGIEKLDSSIRFLVIGEEPDSESISEQLAQEIATLGRIKGKAAELGLTIIPAWKLQSYLRTIDDSLTTPLGSAVRGEDFPPEPMSGRSSLPVDIAEIYKNHKEGMQKDLDGILPP